MTARAVEHESRSSFTTRRDLPLILIVEDERPQQLVLTSALQRRGYHVELAETGKDAIRLAGAVRPDVVLLDLGLPDMSGVEACRHLRNIVDCPILIVSADDLERTMVETLDLGADDYIQKPFSIQVLLARLRVALRHRSQLATVMADDLVVCGDVEIDVSAHQLRIDGAEVELPARCFAVLTLLARNQGNVVTHDTIVRSLAGQPQLAVEPNAVRVLVSKIRRALGEGPRRPSIVAEINVGYRMRPPAP